MAPTLYYNNVSPPVRAVLLTAAALELELDLKEVNLLNKEHLTEEYLKMNPQHTVPTMDDDGYILWDSHAIAGYLVAQYGQDDSLYPQDPKQRGLVDQRLHFDGGYLFPRMSKIFTAIIFKGDKTISEEDINGILQGYEFLEAFLEDREWLAGDNVTIADLCTVAAVSSLNLQIPIEAETYPRLAEWFARCEALPYYEDANGVGLQRLAMIMKMKMEE